MGKSWHSNVHGNEAPILTLDDPPTSIDTHNAAFYTYSSPPVEVLEELSAAIDIGDNLPNSFTLAKAQRRALVVAIDYEGDARHIGRSLYLPNAAVDAQRVYRMLLSRGYQAQNIRILVSGMTPNSDPTKRHIADSLEWLVHNTEPGDYRYFHFSGHGQAYEVPPGQGKMARVRPDGTSLHNISGVESTRPTARFREALLTEWRDPSFKETQSLNIELDAYNRIDDEELNTVLAKLPKGCTLTVTLDCVHGTRMNNVNAPSKGPGWRGEAGTSLAQPEPECGQSITIPLDMSRNTSACNMFVPPAFYLHSNFSFDPNVTMERVQGPDPLHEVKATVFAWSGFSTKSAQAGVFISAFTNAAQSVEGDISHRGMFQDVSRRVGEASAVEGQHAYHLVQLWVSCDGTDDDAEELMSNSFVI